MKAFNAQVLECTVEVVRNNMNKVALNIQADRILGPTLPDRSLGPTFTC